MGCIFVFMMDHEIMKAHIAKVHIQAYPLLYSTLNTQKADNQSRFVSLLLSFLCYTSQNADIRPSKSAGK